MNGNVEFYMLTVEMSGWRIAVYISKRPDNTDFTESFDISCEDRRFIEQNIKEYRRGLFLLKGGQCSVLISTHLYFSSGLLLAAVIDEPISFLATLKERGELGDIGLSPSCIVCEFMKRLSKEKCENILRITDSIRVLTLGFSVISEAEAYPMVLLLAEKAKLASSLAKCYLETENGGVFGNVENYDISLFTAFLICATAYVKRAGVDRTGSLVFSSSFEKLYVTLETEALPNTRAFEFDALRSLTDSLEVSFSVTEEKGRTYARLCAMRPDLSMLGLKNDIFLR